MENVGLIVRLTKHSTKVLKTSRRELDKGCRCDGHRERALLLRTRSCLSPNPETAGWELRFHSLPGSPATLCLSLAGIRRNPPGLWVRHQKTNDKSGLR